MRPVPNFIDVRSNRAALAATIRAFLNQELSPAAFEEAINEFQSNDDSTTQFVRDFFVYFFFVLDDDDSNDTECLWELFQTKKQWDTIQRLLLLLESDATVETTVTRRWTWSQLGAARTLLGMIAGAVVFGWNWRVGTAWLIAGGIAMWQMKQRTRLVVPPAPLADIIWPFATIDDLAAAYDSTGFIKQRFPSPQVQLKTLEVKSKFATFADELLQRALIVSSFLVWAPLILLFQLTPVTTVRTLARMPS